MKIKKVNELIASELSENELNDIRSKRFNVKEETEYHIYGEDLSNISPRYDELIVVYDIESCINWYEDYLDDVKSSTDPKIITREKLTGNYIRKIYDNIVVSQVETESKFIDLDVIINSEKYNL